MEENSLLVLNVSASSKPRDTEGEKCVPNPQQLSLDALDLHI
jgi:hypothetical protein